MREPTDDVATRSDRAYPGTPLWVKLFAIVALAVVAIFLLVVVVGSGLGLHTPPAGGHGP